MTKAEKQQIVSELTSEFKEANAIVVCDYKGMTCQQIEALRADARDNNAKVKVVKNTLALIALREAGRESLEIRDTNIVIWGNDQLATCKVVDRAATANKEKFVIKSAILEGSPVDAKTVIAMAKLPGREELLGMLLNVWNGPARAMAIALQALATKKAKEVAA